MKMQQSQHSVRDIPEKTGLCECVGCDSNLLIHGLAAATAAVQGTMKVSLVGRQRVGRKWTDLQLSGTLA